jgi:putative flippase GtrA
VAGRFPGDAGRVLRFVAAGGFVAVVNIGGTAVLYRAVGLPIQASVAIAYLAAITTHFTLQRVFVFAGQAGFALSLGAQVRRYAALAAVQYPLTAGLVAVLTSAGLPGLASVVVAAVIVTPVTFIIMRTRLFHAAAAD